MKPSEEPDPKLNPSDSGDETASIEEGAIPHDADGVSEVGKASPPPSIEPPALEAKNGYWVLAVLIVVVFVADQWTKHWTANLSGLTHGIYPPAGGIELIPGFLAWVYATNHGAAWGMLAGHLEILIVLGFVALAVIYFYRRELELHLVSRQIAFGLLIGGILGNLVDRSLHGYVIDFIDVDLGFYRWPTFNIADMGISIGVGLYLLLSFFPSKQHGNSPNGAKLDPKKTPENSPQA